MIEIQYTRRFDERLATKLGDVNAAIIISQLDYWIRIRKDCRYGVTFEGDRYIYNSFSAWVQDQFSWLTEWKFRRSMSLLRRLKLVKVERLKVKEWDQTNHYTLDYQALAIFQSEDTQNAETIENSELRSSSDQEEEILAVEREEASGSIKDQNITDKEKTTNKKANVVGFVKTKENTGDNQDNVVLPEKSKTKAKKSKKQRTEKGSKIDIINSQWTAHLEKVKKLGVRINSTVIKYLKMTALEVVENAIAALQEKDHLPNKTGFFIQAIKGKWIPNNPGSSTSSENSDRREDNDFYKWLRLARKYGYCSRYEFRGQEPWVLMMGGWQKFSEAIAVLTFEYLYKMQTGGS